MKEFVCLRSEGGGQIQLFTTVILKVGSSYSKGRT